MCRLILTLLATSLLAVAADPFAGVWKPTQLGQWKTSPGTRDSTTASVITFEAKSEDTLHVTFKDATTDKIRLERDWVLNGKDFPDVAGVGTFSAKRIKAKHLQTLQTTAKGSLTNEWVVSADGKTLTLYRKGTGTTTGRAIDEVQLYAKLP